MKIDPHYPLQREVKILADNTPATITLPRPEQFVPGYFCRPKRSDDSGFHLWTNGPSDCGCLLGHAYYAFGISIGPTSAGREMAISTAIRFAYEVAVAAGIHRPSAADFPFTWRDFDDWIVAATLEEGGLAEAQRKIAYAWRVVATRWGYDVRASEPNWEVELAA